MTDPQALLGALTSLKTAAEIVKGLRQADVSFERTELKLKIADLATALADARMASWKSRTKLRASGGRSQS